ncbi:hypothetical protein IWW56_001316 [Coemansia sp. RSA 2131]|nr:hypothetical protein IWW56_001316 [Coemansia sp. RSA 2131]
MNAEIARVLAVLQGQQRFERSHCIAGANGAELSLGASRGNTDTMLNAQKKPDVWAIPASVGPDLIKPIVLREIVSQWPTLDDTQKVNVLLGIAHVGHGRMREVANEVRQIAQLAKQSVSSDWVRTLGDIIGEVGTVGKMRTVSELDEPTRSEIEGAIAQVAQALEKSSLCVVPSVLSYVSSDAAKTIAPSNIRNIYGRAPSAKELDSVMAQAKKRTADIRSPPSSRRPSMAPSSSVRPSTAEPDGSAASSQLNSPEPSSADATSCFGLFGGESDDDESEENDMSTGDDTLVLVNNYTLPMNVKSSHRADHVGRLSRLLAVASSVSSSASGFTSAQSAPGDARGSAIRGAQGGQPASGLGMRRGASAGGGKSKLGMIAPRRRAAATPSLPSAGLGSVASSRRADSGTAITQVTKKIRLANIEETADSMNDRERLLQARRDKAAQDREAKRQKQQEAAEERKRQREENRLQKQAGTTANTAKRAKRQSKSTPGLDETGDGSQMHKATSPGTISSDDESDVPLEYRTYTGDTPDRQALYTNTNALKDADRKLMYCFFKGLDVPPNTGDEVKFALNEATIDDPRYPGKKCTEIMMFKANLLSGKWDKIRRLKR